MERKIFENPKNQITFPEGSALIIEKILEDNGLDKVQEEGIEKFSKSKVFQERIEIFEKLPGTKISKLVKACAEKKIFLKDLSLQLEKELSIPDKKAKKIAKDLEEKILVFVKPEKKGRVPPSEISSIEAEEKPVSLEQSTSPEGEKTISRESDVYRESIE